jgi:hypothetical protein
LGGLDQNPSGSLRKYNCLVKNLICKTLREKPGEGKECRAPKRLTNYSGRPILFLVKALPIVTGNFFIA